MHPKTTEARHRQARGIDARSDGEILSILHAAQLDAAAVVADAQPALARAAGLAAAALKDGGRLVYAGAGSSGLMAMADALELPGTYGIPSAQVKILLAGGAAALTDLAGGPEDDRAQAAADCRAIALCAADCVIVVTASGSTPYALEVADQARAAGAATIGMANNDGAALFAKVDCAILLATPPEVISGSTRMGAGTAQKIAFNMFSTLLGIRLGHVHDGLMVNVRADNEKLRGRAAGIVAEIAGLPVNEAAEALDRAEGSVKAAVLIARGVGGKDIADNMLRETGGRLREALARTAGRQ